MFLKLFLIIKLLNTSLNFFVGSVNHMFGTAIRRFTAVMFKNSYNNSYSI